MFTIFSKPGCVFCEKFKAIVELEDIKHVVYELGRDFTKEEFYSKSVSYTHLTLPTILRV